MFKCTSTHEEVSSLSYKGKQKAANRTMTLSQQYCSICLSRGPGDTEHCQNTSLGTKTLHQKNNNGSTEIVILWHLIQPLAVFSLLYQLASVASLFHRSESLLMLLLKMFLSFLHRYQVRPPKYKTTTQ